MLRLYRTAGGAVVERDGRYWTLPDADWDALINRDDLHPSLTEILKGASHAAEPDASQLLPPIANQEVWGAGVTYLRSREARAEESKSAGGGDFYDRVYTADRPELFFKATAHRVVGHNQPVRIREDSRWNVPEPELALMISSGGKIIGYTIGNDMSSRDIEGENPLYLPQAKTYDGCCALGPCVLVSETPLPKSTEIDLSIFRNGQRIVNGKTSLNLMKRELESLVEFLFRESSFPNGCFLLTGTGIVPPDSFTLRGGDNIEIKIEPIGTLRNTVA